MTAEQARVRWAKAYEEQCATQSALRALAKVNYADRDETAFEAAKERAFRAGCAETHARKVYEALQNAAWITR